MKISTSFIVLMLRGAINKISSRSAPRLFEHRDLLSEVQAIKAEKLINGKEIVLITDVVLIETVWTLNGKKYQLSKTDLVAVLRALFKEPNIRFENGHMVWMALHDYHKAKSVGGRIEDFSDTLIVNKAKFTAVDNSAEFCGVHTFDIAAQQLPGTKTP